MRVNCVRVKLFAYTLVFTLLILYIIDMEENSCKKSYCCPQGHSFHKGTASLFINNVGQIKIFLRNFIVFGVGIITLTQSIIDTLPRGAKVPQFLKLTGVLPDINMMPMELKIFATAEPRQFIYTVEIGQIL